MWLEFRKQRIKEDVVEKYDGKYYGWKCPNLLKDLNIQTQEAPNSSKISTNKAHLVQLLQIKSKKKIFKASK